MSTTLQESDHPNFFLITSLSSIISGLCAKLICHPIDTIKSKLQISQEKPMSFSFFRTLNQVAQREGIKGLYQGIGISLIGLVPGMGLYFGTYEYCKKNILVQDEIKWFVSGMIAEAVSCVVWLPVDIVKERLQVENELKMGYKGSWNTLKKVRADEGSFGLYRAYMATVFSFGPFSALYFLAYEKQKSLFVQTPTFFQAFCMSSIAGCTASIITNPLEIAKLRMQVQRGKVAQGKQGFGYKHMLHGISQIYQKEGFLSLYKGATARCFYHTPYTAITMGLLESIRGKLLVVF